MPKLPYITAARVQECTVIKIIILNMRLAACPLRDPQWLEFTKPRESSHKAPTNHSNSSRSRRRKGKGFTVQFFKSENSTTFSFCHCFDGLYSLNPLCWFICTFTHFYKSSYTQYHQHIRHKTHTCKLPPGFLSRSRDSRLPGLILLRPSALINQHYTHPCAAMLSLLSKPPVVPQHHNYCNIPSANLS